MKHKLTLSLCSVVIILLVSSIISILEYSRMSNYVSDLIAENIRSINIAQKLSKDASNYNLSILAIIGSGNEASLPSFDNKGFATSCQDLHGTLYNNKLSYLADSVMCSYDAYMQTSKEFTIVNNTDSIDTRDWYFDRLQPVFKRLNSNIDALTQAMYKQLQKNSVTFERGFYRSIIPGMVAVMVGIVVVLLLLFFLMVYYVNPIAKMLVGLNNYRSFNKKYNYSFDGDDELYELNEGITELANENQQLRKRVKVLRQSKQVANNSIQKQVDGNKTI